MPRDVPQAAIKASLEMEEQRRRLEEFQEAEAGPPAALSSSLFDSTIVSFEPGREEHETPLVLLQR